MPGEQYFDGTATVRVAGDDLTFSWSTEGLPIPPDLMTRAVSGILGSGGAPHPGSTVDRILDIVVGSRHTRFDPRPDADGRRILRERIERAVSRNEPVPFSTMWGCIKHYVGDEDQGIDIAEVFTTLRLTQLVADIAEVYEPGARISLIIEDFGVWYEDAYGRPPAVQKSITKGSLRYAEELVGLLDTVAGKTVRPYLFHETVEVDYRECIAQAEHNRDLLHAYWTAGEDCRIQFDELCAAGWRGPIGAETRRHYLTRLEKLYPAESEEERIDRVVRYLAMVLLYEQTGALRKMDPHAIRLSFYQPAPGIAQGRALGRVHLRGLPRRWCSAAMPPWTAKGCWTVEADGTVRPRIESFLALRSTGATYHRGSLGVTRAGRTVGLRMDVVLRDGRPARALALKQYG
ncbi:hypothetical protein ABT061_42905 [Streptosporangium sp. NPDC002544]|uniref:hypothetical protein n=1 Tax=Streptosporangium sp. NPDC002544 TaxID=3154538 RepID=UPI00332BD405